MGLSAADLGAGPLRPDRRSLPAQVADLLVEAMLDGRLAPGTTLPAERALAEQLGITRTSLRQAIARLEQAGLVEARHGFGTVVRDPSEAADATLVLRALLRLGPALLTEVLEVREALGALAGRLAAERAEPADLELLVTRLDGARSAAGAEALQGEEFAVFSALVDVAGNRPLQVMMRWLERLYGATAAFFVAAFEDAGPVIEGLEAVVASVQAGDGSAAETATRTYLQDSGARFLAAADGATDLDPSTTGDPA